LDALIIVEAPFVTRLLRARQRDRLSWGALLRRVRSQRAFRSQYLGSRADIYIVKNRGGRWERDLERQIDKILSREGYER